MVQLRNVKVQRGLAAPRSGCPRQPQHRSQVHPGDKSVGQHLHNITLTKEPRTGSELKKDFWATDGVKVPDQISQANEGLHTGCTQDNNSKMEIPVEYQQPLEFYCIIQKKTE